MDLEPAKMQVSYGAQREQFYRLHQPSQPVLANGAGEHPLVVVIHGGYWRQAYNLDNALIAPIVPFLQHKGYAVAHIEYRRGNQAVDGGEGGWPRTNEDIISALRSIGQIATDQHIDVSRVVLLGHSAGGTLALWPACQGTLDRLPEPLPFLPRLVVAIAPIGDLEYGFKRKLSDSGDAVEKYLHASPAYGIDGRLLESSPYRLASPKELLPMACDCVVILGEIDDVVPVDCIEAFFAHAQANSHPSKKLEILRVAGADHFHLVNPEHAAWMKVFDKMHDMLL